MSRSNPTIGGTASTVGQSFCRSRTAAGGTSGTVLDLGCGPGSLAGRLAERLPGERIVGFDSDPLLLALGRTRYGDRVEFVDADLTDPAWTRHVPAAADAAVSTTALHWLDPELLADHVAALRSAGFACAGTIWQSGDDHVLVAIR